MTNQLSVKNERYRWQDIFINGALVSLGLFFSLILGELFLRIFFPLSVVPDSFLQQRGVPGVRWDQNGFRNKAVPQRVDIVALGDSLTEGFNATMEESWPQTLAILSNKTVYNMGFGGYGPAQYSYLIDKALVFNPDVVMVGFYLGNDLINAFDVVYSNDNWKSLRSSSFVESKEETILSSDKLADDVLMLQFGYVPNFWEYKILKIRLWLRENSRLYSFLGDSTRVIREKLTIVQGQKSINENIEKYLASNSKLGFVYNEGNIKTVLSVNYRLETVNINNKETKEGYRITKDIFLQMSQRLKDKNKNLIIAIVPTKELVYGEYFKKQNIHTDPNPLFWTLLDREIELREDFLTFCKNNGLLCMDTSSGMVESLKNNTKIFSETLESHPIGRGYQVIAETIFDYLKRKEIIK